MLKSYRLTRIRPKNSDKVFVCFITCLAECSRAYVVIQSTNKTTKKKERVFKFSSKFNVTEVHD